ncbi:MAG: S41 family peptidase [Gammaproteobacteria bacterium]
MNYVRIWLATSLMIVVCGCTGSGALSTRSSIPFSIEHHPGVWLSQGYGYVLHIRGDRVRLFHLAGDICVEEKEIESSILPHLDLVRTGARNDVMTLSSVLDPYEYNFERKPVLPAPCRDPMPNTAIGNFEAFAAFFAEHYAFFDLYGVDWTTRVAKARPNVANDMSDLELFELMRGMVLPLRDSHLQITAEVDGLAVVHDGNPGKTEGAIDSMASRLGINRKEMLGQFRRTYWFDGIGDALLKGKGLIAGNGRIQYGMVADNIGYLAIVTMGGYVNGETDSLHAELSALDTVMEDALTFFNKERAKAIIVDLSMNTGGYDFVGTAIASRFAASSTVAFTKRPGDYRAAQEFAIRVEPAVGSRFAGRVYLLTSDMTRSAAEVMTLSMRALDNVTHVGEPTRGAFSTVLEKCLPNGWCLSLSNEIYTDHRGEVWEGRGIEPDAPISVFNPSAPLTGHPEAVRAVIELIDREVDLL